MPSTTDTCRRRIEVNDPPLKSLEIECFFHEHSQSARVKMKCHPIGLKPQQYYVYNDFYFQDHNAWSQIGQAIGNNETITELKVDGDVNANSAICPGAARCLEAFYDGVKQSKSIETLHLDVFPSHSVSMFDLGHFLQYNTQLNDIRLSSEVALTPDQCVSIATAVGGASLRQFDIHKCIFGDSASFNQIVSACLGVDTLAIKCEKNHQCSALAAVLRDSRARLREVHLYPDKTPGDNKTGGMSTIAASLVGNTKLKKIDIQLGLDEDLSPFGSLLCDASSVDSIRNSNHTLEEIGTVNFLPPPVGDCLKLNRLENKDEVIRKKIAQYYQDTK